MWFSYFQYCLVVVDKIWFPVCCFVEELEPRSPAKRLQEALSSRRAFESLYLVRCSAWCYSTLPELLKEKEVNITAVILLQIVTVSPGTHFVKNRESRTSESQLKKKKRIRNWKCFDLYVTRQLIWRELQNSLLQYTEIKILPFYFKAQQRLKEIRIVKQQP